VSEALTALDLSDVTARKDERARQRVSAAEVVDQVSQVIGRQRHRRKLLVYVHIPFCTSKCNFCHWVAGIPTAELRSAEDVRWRYVRALERQIEWFASRLAALSYMPEFVYWGGGTPSMLNPEQIHAVGAALERNFDLSGVREYSIETSPETLSSEKLRAFKAAGMTRLSIGVQSFDSSELRRAGRAHSAEDAESAICLAKGEKCDNLNIDIITGFPKQTPEILDKTLERTLELRPEHVTAYTYQAAQGTVMGRQLGRGHVMDIGVEQRAKAMDRTYSSLAAAGYGEYMSQYYSISSAHVFAGESYYFDWQGDYIGFGSGANSILASHLVTNLRGQLESYIDSPTLCSSIKRMSQATAIRYAARLLLVQGRPLDYERFNGRFGFDFEPLLHHPRLRALRLVLNRLGAPLILTSGGAYISPPEKGWHGGDLLRLSSKVGAVLAAAHRQSRGARQLPEP
jgi:coproporphyrinogen III oxidase-like Fe-S oxidoreductase